MTINCLWNKRCGPGGGTRRLHHKIWGRNRIDTRNKDKTFVRHGSAVIGLNLINVDNKFVDAVIAKKNKFQDNGDVRLAFAA